MVTDSNYTQQDPEDGSDDWLARQFQIDRALANVRTIVQVEVMSVMGGGVGAPPTVSVKPVVKVVDGQNNVTSHGTINNIPVTRVGCGNGSVICDPVAGDVGWMAIADRDSSVVQSSSGAESQPGSRRMFDLADGIYIGTLFGGAPTQFLQFTTTGINLKDKNGNSITTSAAGMTQTDANGNVIQMKAGIVNIVTGVFQVNGVPVTIP
jgi:hypothetical protein